MGGAGMIGSLRARFGRRSLMYGAAFAAVSAGALMMAVTPASAADSAAKSAPAKGKASAKKTPGFDFGNWSSYLGSGSSSQFSNLKQITKANVGQLQVAWT